MVGRGGKDAVLILLILWLGEPLFHDVGRLDESFVGGDVVVVVGLVSPTLSTLTLSVQDKLGFPH